MSQTKISVLILHYTRGTRETGERMPDNWFPKRYNPTLDVLYGYSVGWIIQRNTSTNMTAGRCRLVSFLFKQ